MDDFFFDFVIPVFASILMASVIALLVIVCWVAYHEIPDYNKPKPAPMALEKCDAR